MLRVFRQPLEQKCRAISSPPVEQLSAGTLLLDVRVSQLSEHTRYDRVRITSAIPVVALL